MKHITHLDIDTSNKNQIKLSLTKDDKKLASKSIEANFNHIEILLPTIEKFLAKHNTNITQLTKVTSAKTGDSFTALRLGITTANALNFALSNTQTIVTPKYNKEPNIM